MHPFGLYGHGTSANGQSPDLEYVYPPQPEDEEDICEHNTYTCTMVIRTWCSLYWDVWLQALGHDLMYSGQTLSMCA